MKRHILLAPEARMMTVNIKNSTKTTTVPIGQKTTMQATNDYLEQKEHYTVMNVGNGVFRFYIPICMPWIRTTRLTARCI